MGSPRNESGRNDREVLHRERIGHSYAIAAKLVTVEQYCRFRTAYRANKEYARSNECPALAISWYEAAEYCNWLSEQEGLPATQLCYERNEKGEFGEGMKPSPDFLRRTGYRLPTEAEWECACRAGAGSSWYFGQSEKLLPKYGWYQGISGGHSWPVGNLKPNDFGLFDMHGNALSWCQSKYSDYRAGQGATAADDSEDATVVTGAHFRVLRGGAFDGAFGTLRCAYRSGCLPSWQDYYIGLRLAKTCN
jgi:formylglycine-generating enzyme required for sulfatase activity